LQAKSAKSATLKNEVAQENSPQQPTLFFSKFSYMGDLLDLFLEFEKRLITLCRDLVRRPEKVGASIHARDKQYLSGYKFYTLIASIWIVVMQIGNRYLNFFEDDYFYLPNRINQFLQSEQDFAFLIAPFVGLLEFLLPMATLNWILLRKLQWRWVDHLSYNLMLGGLIFLYLLPVFLILYSIGNNTSFGQTTFFNLLANFMGFGVPVLFYGWAYSRITERKKWLAFALSVISILVTGYGAVSLYSNVPIHEFIHRKILFSQYTRHTLLPDEPTYQYVYNDTIFREDADRNIFRANQSLVGNASSQWFVVCDYSRVNQTHTYSLTKRVGTSLVKFALPFDSVPDVKSFLLLAEGSDLTIIQRSLTMPDRAPVFTLIKGDTLISKSKFFPISSHVREPGVLGSNNEVFVAAASKTNNYPVLISIKEFSAKEISIDKSNYTIDDMKFDPFTKSQSIQLLMSLTEKGKLKEIVWQRGSLQGDEYREAGRINLYKNEFNPTYNGDREHVHRGRITPLNDSISLVSFQVMTDSSFALNVSKINSQKQVVLWNRIITLPFDLNYYDGLLADADNVYLFGRVASIFSPGFSLYYHQLPFVQTLDVHTGDSRKLTILKMEADDKFPVRITYPDEIYRDISSWYEKDGHIYLEIHGHFYDLNKTAL
jgi:hypothetical protein